MLYYEPSGDLNKKVEEIKEIETAREQRRELIKKGGEFAEELKKLPKVRVKSGLLKLTNYVDNVELFYDMQPFFYDKAKIFWLWNKKKFKWEIVDDTDIMNAIDQSLEFGGETVTAGLKANYLEAFKRVGRKNIPKKTKKTWIQFRDLVIDIENSRQFKATPEYFVTNPIPTKIGESDETPVMDKIFQEWVGVENIDLLYEIIAYSMLPSYPIHRIFCLVGVGLNGKSKFLELLTNFIGRENVLTTELDILLNSRFETSKLYKKLVCLMGETNFNEISKTSILKRLTGQDLIGFEMKHKPPFDDYNYAKIIIATNTLPITKDRTIGFYRRWVIIDFPNKFTEKEDILKRIPKEEYENFARKAIVILERILKEREFTNEGTVEEREQRYEEKSNPLKKFIELFIIASPYGYIYKYEFRDRFQTFLTQNRHRVWNEKEIGVMMKEMYEEKQTGDSGWRAWVGIAWKDEKSEEVVE